ncbi:glycosyltransferase [Lactobacillus sp. PSON]|uniref:glycosyltransferase n=1 Tax=Lactobacillus sp. PSON TaxID=3455454 RepID=UPI00404246D1
MKNKLNVVCEILNYNDAETVFRLVDKIKDFPVFNSILIVDNDSPDNSFSKLLNRYYNNNKIVVNKTAKNGGYGYGNNYGIKYAYEKLNADYVLLANPDVSFSNEMVQKLLNEMVKKNAAIVAGTQRINGIPIRTPAWKIPTAMQWTLIETKLWKYAAKKYYYDPSLFELPDLQVECVHGAMFLLDPYKFLDVDGYDEEMFLFGEETVLGYKLKSKGYTSFLLNNVYYDHEGSTSIKKSFNSSIKQDQITHQSKLIYMKNYLHINKLELMLNKSIFNFVILKKKLKDKINATKGR